MVKMVTPRKALEYKDSEGNSPFKKWLTELKDARGRVKVTKAITQMESGNFGDHKPITDGNTGTPNKLWSWLSDLLHY